MNGRQARDFLDAAAACDPGGVDAARTQLVADAVEAAPAAQWEGAVRGGDALVFRLAPRRAGEPGTRRFSAKLFAEPIAGALRIFDALEPVAAMRLEPGGAAWSLLLERPVPWPRFLRCDLSAGFAPRAAQLSLLLRDARVVALDFDGEALWARFE